MHEKKFLGKCPLDPPPPSKPITSSQLLSSYAYPLYFPLSQVPEDFFMAHSTACRAVMIHNISASLLPYSAGIACVLSFQRCPDGTYSSAAAGSCQSCPAGQYCFDGTNYVSPTNCAAGEYSGAGETTCSTCASGGSQLCFFDVLEVVSQVCKKAQFIGMVGLDTGPHGRGVRRVWDLLSSGQQCWPVSPAGVVTNQLGNQ